MAAAEVISSASEANVNPLRIKSPPDQHRLLRTKGPRSYPRRCPGRWKTSPAGGGPTRRWALRACRISRSETQYSRLTQETARGTFLGKELAEAWRTLAERFPAPDSPLHE